MKRHKFNIYAPSGGRTSVRVDRLLYEYFSVSLGKHPDDSDSQRHCEKWLEDRLSGLPVDTLASQVRQLIIAQIAKPSLEDKLQRLRLH